MLNLRLAYCRCRLLSRFLRTGRQDRVQRVAFLPGAELNDAAIANIFNQALQNATSPTCTRHFAAAEENRRLDFVALIQKAQHVVLLGLVVVIVHIDAELHFFDRDGLLVLLGFAFLFFLLIKKLPIIHDAANRRLRGGGNFYQIQVLFASHLERFKGWHDADLLAFVANHADFARANTIICTDKTFIDTKPPSILKGVGMKNYSIRRWSSVLVAGKSSVRGSRT